VSAHFARLLGDQIAKAPGTTHGKYSINEMCLSVIPAIIILKDVPRCNPLRDGSMGQQTALAFLGDSKKPGEG
jgi:hypothetical protein